MRIVEKWFVTPVKGNERGERGPLRIWGIPKDNVENRDGLLWRSSSIVRRLSSSELLTRYGTTIRLCGPIDAIAAAQVSMNPEAITAFTTGFPIEWHQLAQVSFTTESQRENETNDENINNLSVTEKCNTPKRKKIDKSKRARSNPITHVQMTAEPRCTFEPSSKRRRVSNQIRTNSGNTSPEKKSDEENDSEALEGDPTENKIAMNNQTSRKYVRRNRKSFTVVPTLYRSSQSTVGDDDSMHPGNVDLDGASARDMVYAARNILTGNVKSKNNDVRLGFPASLDDSPQTLVDDETETERDESVEPGIIPPSALAAREVIVRANTPGLPFTDSL